MQFATSYERWITWIVQQCPAPDKFAHTYAGLFLYLGAAIILRKPLRSRVPLLIVLALEIANELVDRVAHGSWMWHDTLGDIAATLFWPAVLTLCIAKVSHLGR